MPEMPSDLSSAMSIRDHDMMKMTVGSLTEGDCFDFSGALYVVLDQIGPSVQCQESNGARQDFSDHTKVLVVSQTKFLEAEAQYDKVRSMQERMRDETRQKHLITTERELYEESEERRRHKGQTHSIEIKFYDGTTRWMTVDEAMRLKVNGDRLFMPEPQESPAQHVTIRALERVVLDMQDGSQVVIDERGRRANDPEDTYVGDVVVTHIDGRYEKWDSVGHGMKIDTANVPEDCPRIVLELPF